MSTVTESVIKAVVSRVKSQVSDISNKIFFEPPQKTDFPYMQFTFTVADIPIKDANAQSFQVTFNTFCQRTSDAALVSATRINKKLYDAFDNYALTLDTGHAFASHWDGLETYFPEEDGRTVQGVMRFKIMTTNS